MWGKALSRKNSDFLDTFIQLVERRTFDPTSTNNHLWHLHNQGLHRHNEEEDRLFLKYKITMCQPFNVVEFYGNKNIRKEFAVIHFISSEEANKLNFKPITKATLIRSFSNDYKLVFEDKAYYSVTRNLSKRRFYLPMKFKRAKASHEQVSWDNEVNVVIIENNDQMMSLGIHPHRSDNTNSLSGDEYEELRRTWSDESADSIVFLSTGNSHTKEIRDKMGIVIGNELLSPDSNNSL